MYIENKDDLINRINNKEYHAIRVPKQARWLIAETLYNFLLDKCHITKDKSAEVIQIASPGKAWLHRGLANPSQWILQAFSTKLKDQGWWEDFVYAVMKVATQELPTIQMYLTFNEMQAGVVADQMIQTAYYYSVKQHEISQSAIEQLILQCDDPVVIINNSWRKAREWVYHMSKDTQWLITRLAEDDWRLTTVADTNEPEYRYSSNRELLPKSWLNKPVWELSEEYDVDEFIFVNKDLNQASFRTVEAAKEVADTLVK